LTDPIPVSVVVIARNEERGIADCLRSAARLAESFVVDSHSDDRTADIAASLGAKVVEFSWDGDYPKKEPAWRLEQAAVRAADSVVVCSPDVPNITVRAPEDRRDYDSELPARLSGRARAYAEQKLAKAPALERFEAGLG
jgi:glycosyltransferase involved in cell wall biosynthesis